MAEQGGTDAVPAPRRTGEAEGPVPAPRHAAAHIPDQRPRGPGSAPRHARPDDGEAAAVRPPVPAVIPPQVGRHLAPQAGPVHAPRPRGPFPTPPGYGVPGYGPVPYTPPLPPAPRSRVPAWVLPATLSAVIVLAGAAIAGIAVTALDAGQGTASTVAAGTGDRAFLSALGTTPSFADIPDSTLIQLGRGVCTALEDGATHGQLVSDAVSAGFGTRDARLLVDAANAAYCPGE
jgi:hypothetical protein